MFDSSTGHRQFSSNHIEKKGENIMLDCCLYDDGSENNSRAKITKGIQLTDIAFLVDMF